MKWFDDWIIYVGRKYGDEASKFCKQMVFLYLFLFICIVLNEIALMIYAPNTLMEVVYIWKYYIPFVFDTGGK